MDTLLQLAGLIREQAGSADFDEDSIRRELARLLNGRVTLSDIGISDEDIQKIHERSKLRFDLFRDEWADAQPFRMLHRQYPGDVWMTRLWTYALVYAMESIGNFSNTAQAELAGETEALLRDYGALPEVRKKRLSIIYQLLDSRVSAPVVLRGLCLLSELASDTNPPPDLWESLNRKLGELTIEYRESAEIMAALQHLMWALPQCPGFGAYAGLLPEGLRLVSRGQPPADLRRNLDYLQTDTAFTTDYARVLCYYAAACHRQDGDLPTALRRLDEAPGIASGLRETRKPDWRDLISDIMRAYCLIIRAAGNVDFQRIWAAAEGWLAGLPYDMTAGEDTYGQVAEAAVFYVDPDYHQRSDKTYGICPRITASCCCT